MPFLAPALNVLAAARRGNCILPAPDAPGTSPLGIPLVPGITAVPRTAPSPAVASLRDLPRWLIAAAFAVGGLWPVYEIFRLAVGSQVGRSEAALALAVAFGLLFVMRWDIVPYFLRAVCAAVVIFAAFRLAGGPAAAIATTAIVITHLVLRRPPSTSALEVEFPLRSGSYFIASAGRWELTNRHVSSLAQRYALDITRLNGIAARARGFYPARLSAYRIFGVPVNAPCEGRVEEAVDGFPDLPIGERGSVVPGGNYVILRVPGDIQIKLSHFQRGSLAVKAGDFVTAGDFLGRVGNSGNTSEPHLHIHAQRPSHIPGEPALPVPLRFNGRWLIRNDIFYVPQKPQP